MKYNAFISYSHADKELPKSIQSGLRLLAKPWLKLEALTVFRDVSNLTVSPELWPDIEKALDLSDFFVLLASPEAAKSKWVHKEVEHWIKNKPKGTLLLALVNGQLAWDETKADFDWEITNAIPRVLSGAFSNEPNYANFLKFKDGQEVTLDNVEFQEEIAKLAAPLHGKSVGELIGLQEKQFRSKIRLRNITIVSLLILLLATAFLAILFKKQQNQAERESIANGLGMHALSEERIDPTKSIAKLLEGFKISGDSSLYSLAISLYDRNYIYDKRISIPGMRVKDFSNGTIISVSLENKYTIIRSNDTLRGDLKSVVAQDEIGEVQLNRSGDFFLIKLGKSGKIFLVDAIEKQMSFIEALGVTFDQLTDDFICLSSNGEIKRYYYRDRYRNPAHLSYIKDQSLINKIKASHNISIKVNVEGSTLLINHSGITAISTKTGSKIHELEKIDAGPHNIFCVSKTGKYVAVDSIFQIVIYKNGKRERSLKGHRNYITSLEFSTISDDLLISTSDDMTGAIYHLNTDERKELLGHMATPYGRFFADGSSFATYDNDNILIWPLTGLPFKELAESSVGFNCVKISHDNKYLAAADMNGQFWLWTFNGNLIIDSFLISDQFMKERIAFDKKEDVLYFVSKLKNSILSYDIKKKKIVEMYFSSAQVISALVITDDNKLLAFSESGKILLPSNSGKELVVKSIREEYMNIMSVRSHEGKIYVCNDEGQVLVLSKLGNVIDTIRFGDELINVQSVDISRTKAYMAITGNTGDVKVYNGAKSLVLKVPVRASYNMDVKFLNASNDFFTAADDQTIKAWDIQGRQLATYHTGAKTIIYSIDISVDDNFMVTADDTKVILWRIKEPMMKSFSMKQ